MNFVQRFQRQSILNAIHTRRVLLLAGPRQCGKTTLTRHLDLPQATYRTLDDITLLQAAETDPQGFIKNAEGTMVIDEVQRAPLLLQAIKKTVDEDNRNGQYLLTGSANINALPNVHESLAGRVQKIRLRTLTQAEIQGAAPIFLARAFSQEFAKMGALEDKRQILEYCFAGGFPEALRLSPKHQGKWHKDYIEALLERDLREISNIHKLDAMQSLIKVMCAWSGKFIDISAIGANLSIRRPTLESYINALEILYLIERVPPWAKRDYQRTGKQFKLFVTDCGLVSSLLNWKMDDVCLDSDRSGKIIETFVYNELATQIDANDRQYTLYHYRDREKREIDFLIEREDGALLGIEVKAGSNVGLNDFKHLSWFQANMAQDTPFVGIIVYTGEHIVPFGPNLWAVPCGQLWARTSD